MGINESTIDEITTILNIMGKRYRDKFLNKKNTKVQILLLSKNGDVKSTVHTTDLYKGIKRLINEKLLPNITDYSAEDFMIDRIQIVEIKSDPIHGNYQQQLHQQNQHWHQVENNAKFNCVFQSIAICRNWKTNKTLLTQQSNDAMKSGRELKRKTKPTIDNYADYRTIQETSNYTHTPITIYNDLFHPIRTFQPVKNLYIHGTQELYFKDNINHYHIKQANNHCIALIEKKAIREHFPDFDIEANAIKPPQQSQPIKTPETPTRTKLTRYTIPHHNQDNVGTIYIPPHTSQDQPIITYINNKQSQFDTIEQALAHLHNFNNYTIYIHDQQRAIQTLARQAIQHPRWILDGKKCIENNNSWITIALRDVDDRKHTLKILNSHHLLTANLNDLCKDFNINISNTNPCKSLYTIMTKFRKTIYDVFMTDITHAYTIAGLSRIIYFKNHYNPITTPIFNLTQQETDFIRKSYHGGRMEIFKIGKIIKPYLYDFNSHYPAPPWRPNHYPMESPSTQS